MKQPHFTSLMFFIPVAFSFFSAPVTAQSIYRWTDAQGRVHFSNAPVSEATAVDEELPPATSFGGVQDTSPSPLQTPRSTEQQQDTQRSTAALTPAEREVEEGGEQANDEEPPTLNQEPAAAAEEPIGIESEEPERENGEYSNIESLPQASVDFSERKESGTQTVASETQRPSLLDEDEDSLAPETRDTGEEDLDEDEEEGEEDSDGVDENEDGSEVEEEDS